MSLLKSYSFGYLHGKSEITEETLGLFTCLISKPDKKVTYASEIVEASQKGNIDYSRPFNFDGYEMAIRKNEELAKHKRLKKEIVFEADASVDDADFSSGVLTESYVSNNTVELMEDAYESILLDEELKYAVETIKSLQPILLEEEKFDMIATIRQALRGIPSSIARLKSICAEYIVVAEQIQTVLGSGYSFEELFA